MLGFLGDLAGAALNFFSNGWTNNVNAQNVSATNAANLQIARETNALNQQLNAQNIAFQQAENDITRQREDNAVQRRAADLVAAGLSKTLAAGSAASANALQAPRNTFSMEKSAPMQAFQRKAFKLQNEQLGTAILENQVRQKELEYKDSQLDILSKQGSLLDKQIEWFGYPDWAIAIVDAFGLDTFKSFFKRFGDKLLSPDVLDSDDPTHAGVDLTDPSDYVSKSGGGLAAANGLPGASDYTYESVPSSVKNRVYNRLRSDYHDFLSHGDKYYYEANGKPALTRDGLGYINYIAHTYHFSPADAKTLVMSWAQRGVDAYRKDGAKSLGGGYAW